MQLQEVGDEAVSSPGAALCSFGSGCCAGAQEQQEGSKAPVPLQMELESTGPSVPSVIHDENGNVLDSRDPSGEPIQFVFEEISWQQEIPWQEAAHRLEVAMYPFKKVRKGLGSPWHVD